MFERYTERARRVLFFARYEASQLGSISIETEHLLLGLIREGKGLTSRIFARSHLSLENIRKEIEGRTVFREKVSTSVEIPFSAETKRVLQFAAEEADRLLHNYIGTEHLLLGILREERSVAASILMEKGMRLHTVREDIVQLLNEKTTLTRGQGDAAAGRVQPRPDRSGDEEPARSAGRPRLRARARAAGALPPHQEQRRAHRRAGRRQDGDRRRAGAEDRLRRRAALPRRQAHPRARHLADRRRHEVPRPVRRAPQGDHEGAHREPEHHRVHRRAAHAGRRGLGRRLARRGQHPEAGAVARRDPLHRRDDAGRVPEVHREGSLARAPLPGDQGRSARREGNDRDPDGREGSLRAVPSRRVHARGDRGGGLPVEPLHHRSVPAGQGDRPGRRGRRARQAEGSGLQRGVRRDQQEHPRRRRADGERGLAEGLREGAVLPRAGSSRRRENLQFVREKFDVKSSARKVVVGKADIDEVVSKWTGVPIASINQDEGDKLLRMEADLHRASSARRRRSRRSRAPSAAHAPG